MEVYNGSIFDPTAQQRALRALLIGLILGVVTGVMMGGLAATGRVGNG